MHVFPLEFAISLSHSSLLHPPRSKTIRVEIDIDTGHWNLIHSADEPKLERVFGGKIERSMLRTLFFRRRENFTFERKEGRNRTIPREKFCRPLERIIERACSSPPRTNRRDTILSVRRPMQLVSSNPRETGVPYIYIGSSSVRFPIFNGGRVAFVLPLSLQLFIVSFIWRCHEIGFDRDGFRSYGTLSSFTFDFEKYARSLI